MSRIFLRQKKDGVYLMTNEGPIEGPFKSRREAIQTMPTKGTVKSVTSVNNQRHQKAIERQAQRQLKRQGKQQQVAPTETTVPVVTEQVAPVVVPTPEQQ